MKARNISFAQVLQGKSRSPQLKTESQASSSLFELFDQFQQYPDQDYTLYLGGFKSTKSRHSTLMFASKGNEEEEMFDSWIQKQSTVNANKENIVSQPRRQTNSNSPFKVSPQNQQPARFAFNSKGSSKGVEVPKVRNIVSERQPSQLRQVLQPPRSQQPKINLHQFNNIGGNIQMIKSNTCEKEELYQVRSPKRHEEISLQVQEVEFKKRSNSREDEKVEERRYYGGFPKNKANTEIEEVQEEPEPQPEQEDTHEYHDNTRNEQISQMIKETSNIHNEIADLAKKYVTQDDLLQSKQSNIQEEEEEDDQLLIGNSERKILVTSGGVREEKMFSEDYQEKARQQESLQRKRREQAKMKLNDLMKDYYNKPKQSDFNFFPARQEKVVQIETPPVGVGYSFASNAMESDFESAQKEFRINNIQQIRSELPSAASKIDSEPDDIDFRKKYVKDEHAEPDYAKNIQSVQYQIRQSIREEEDKMANLPNESFQVKFMKHEEKSIQNNFFIKQSKEILQIEPLNMGYQVSTSHHGIKVSLTDKTPLIQSHDRGENERIQNSFVFDKPENQKIKIVSNQKLKVYSNSGKSSPSQSQKRQNSSIGIDIKTKPFVEPDQQKPELSKPEDKETRGMGSPFETITEVKEVLINPMKSPSPEATYKAGSSFQQKFTTNFTVSTYTNRNSNEYPNYALAGQKNYSQSNSFKHSLNGNHAISTDKSHQDNNLGLPTYGNTNKVMKTSNTFQIYKDSFNFAKTEYKKTETTTNDNNCFERTVKETTCTYNPPTYETKKEGRRSILAELDLKQSINVDEPKSALIKEKSSYEVKGLLDRQLKQSLKESINIKASGEFTFDF